MNYTKLFLIGLLMASTGLLKEHEEEDDIEMEEEEVARVLEIPIRAL